MSNSSRSPLAGLPLRDLCRALAARTPTPSGGSLAAAIGALGAGGVSMTLRYATGDCQVWQEGRADELESLAERLCDLVDRDAGVYDKVTAARALEPGEERETALEKALAAALETPMEIMEACLAGLRLASAGAGEGIPGHLGVDCLAGAHALWAGLEDAYLMVRENAGCLSDPASAEELVRAADGLRKEAAKLLVAVRGQAETIRTETPRS